MNAWRVHRDIITINNNVLAAALHFILKIQPKTLAIPAQPIVWLVTLKDAYNAPLEQWLSTKPTRVWQNAQTEPTLMHLIKYVAHVIPHVRPVKVNHQQIVWPAIQICFLITELVSMSVLSELYKNQNRWYA